MEHTRKKGAYWCLEQPASSLLPFYKPLEVGFLSKLPFKTVWQSQKSRNFQVPLLQQALIRRHNAKIYYLPLGMKGGPTEKLGETFLGSVTFSTIVSSKDVETFALYNVFE